MGYAITKGETFDDVGAVAAPIFSTDGFLCAIVVAGAVEHVNSQSSKLSQLVRCTADEIFALMGCQGATVSLSGQEVSPRNIPVELASPIAGQSRPWVSAV
jgi:hypothetical protein